jgi:hypothetical protein
VLLPPRQPASTQTIEVAPGNRVTNAEVRQAFAQYTLDMRIAASPMSELRDAVGIRLDGQDLGQAIWYAAYRSRSA